MALVHRCFLLLFALVAHIHAAAQDVTFLDDINKNSALPLLMAILVNSTDSSSSQ